MKITKVNDRLYRGPHPLTLDDSNLLKISGVKTILNLERGWFETFHGRLNWEIIQGSLAGLTVLHLHMGDLVAPTTEQLDCALRILNNPEYGIVYVHCLHGVDRTGEVICAARVRLENWDPEDAIKEMLDLGYHKFPYKYLWLPKLKKYLTGEHP